jgi:hypothetical protein
LDVLGDLLLLVVIVIIVFAVVGLSVISLNRKKG